MTLNIIFAGTPEFACPVLQALVHSSHRVVAVYTQPDRPKGRGQQLQMSPIKQMALSHSISVEQPLSLKTAAAEATLKKWNADVMVVVAYGMLLPNNILTIPKWGCVNVHASLLPRWRGASPIQQAILAGDKKTGVTIMQMVAALDAGDMLAKAETEIKDNDNSQTLHDRLCQMGAELLLPTLLKLEQGLLQPETQDENAVTYAKKIEKHQAEIHWHATASMIARQVRAYYGWPVAFTFLNGHRLRIWEASAAKTETDFAPGTLLIEHHELYVACGQGRLKLEKLQLSGGKIVSARDFINSQQQKWMSGPIVLGMVSSC
ncbi:MAG: methionyl-tRNA formyltransferase [Coxiella sp. RIFCSPHIGHO2_12_FULL_42_15]|nr:MAG: methionyl-tRNA formyltransferase [Coxiella sp. RIFCSPHIGHO2_12_FULL_42_15]